MAAGVVQGNIVVESRVHAPGAQPVGDRPKAEHPEGAPVAGDRALRLRRPLDVNDMLCHSGLFT